MKDKDLGRKAKKREARKYQELKEEEELTSPSAVAAARSTRKKSARIGGTADRSKLFAARNSDNKGRPLTTHHHPVDDGIQARDEPKRGARKKTLALAPPFPLEPLEVAEPLEPSTDIHGSLQGQSVSATKIKPTVLSVSPPSPTEEVHTGTRPLNETGPPVLGSNASADPLNEEDLEQDILDASVAPISGAMGEVFEEPPLASAAIEGSWRVKLALIGTFLLLFVGLALGLIFGLKRNDDISVTPSPSMQPSAAPTNVPLLGEWSQLGQDLVGEASLEWFGSSMAMSADGNIVAVGAPVFIAAAESGPGSVRVYMRNGTSWGQLGGIIRGENDGDEFGQSVALSADGMTLAVGAPSYDSSDNNNIFGVYSGQVRIFQLRNDDEWSQVGSNLTGENAFDYFGWSVALSADGTVLAVGGPGSDDNGTNSGHARSFRLVDDEWSPVGSNLNGERSGDQFGWSVALSEDGNVLAVGANQFTDEELLPGYVRIFQLVNGEWSQVGSNLNGDNADDIFGSSVAFSADGTVLAAGAPRNDVNGEDSGYVRIFQLMNKDWLQLGNDIDGKSKYDQFGWSVALSADGTVLAVGADGKNDNGTSSGQVRIFQLVNDDWAQVGSTINGKGRDDRFGTSVALSADGKTVAGGAQFGLIDGDPFTGPRPGYAMVYRLEEEDE